MHRPGCTDTETEPRRAAPRSIAGISRLEGFGFDRPMCLIQMGLMRHEVVMRNIRGTGECLSSEFSLS
jgi:hypothetical protein